MSLVLHGTSYRTLAEPFEEQVERTPEAIALAGDDDSMTYRQLNEAANQLAHVLRSYGVASGDLVAVYMHRTFNAVITIYAIAKAGAAYVPLDPELPASRIAFVLEDTAPFLVITHRLTETLLPEGNWRVVTLDDEAAHMARMPTANLPCDGSPRQRAILLPTSGSTGRPKLVVLSVEQPLAFILWLRKAFPLRQGDTVLHKTPYGFDASIFELFWTSYSGATLVVSRPAGHRDPSYLMDLINEYSITAIYFIPSMLQIFLAEKDLERCRSLRLVFCGGEVLTPRLRDACYARLSAQLINLYGPTEAGAVSYFPVDNGDRASSVPIGWPTATYLLHVLDGSLNPVPVGSMGELYIGCDTGLAWGYHNRPDRTAEQFLPDPFGSAGGRMYRTRDLARATVDRGLEFHGRVDEIVKIRGHLVDCQEIEAVLANLPAIREAVVVARVSKEGDTQLIGYLRTETDTNEEALRSELSAFLAPAMIPSALVFVSEWPLSINGKLDRKQLPEPYAAGSPKIAAASELELAVAGIWTSVVGRSPRSLQEDFFSSGGNSLQAVRLMMRLSDLTGMNLALADLMNCRTVSSLAAFLEHRSSQRWPS